MTQPSEMSPGAQIGRANREAVRRYFASHVGCTNVECGKALGLSAMAVGRHIAALREQWPLSNEDNALVPREVVEALEFYAGDEAWESDGDQGYDHSDRIVTVVTTEPGDALLTDKGARALKALQVLAAAPAAPSNHASALDDVTVCDAPAAPSDHVPDVSNMVAAPSRGEGGDDEQAAYEIGKRDGYEEAVQDVDRLTGGDGEYRFCADANSERHVPDPEAMKAKIVERFNAKAPAPSSYGEVVEALKPFADFGDRMPAFIPDDAPMTEGSPLAKRQVTAGDFRKAAKVRAALKASDHAG